jgi:hypothetical protein
MTTTVKLNCKELQLRKDHSSWLLDNVKFEDFKYRWWLDTIEFTHEEDAILFKLQFDCREKNES